MAELLIYNTDHWMDKMSEKDFQRLSQSADWFKKYLSRDQRGDVIEVRPDGYWTGPKARGFRRDVFRVISLPGVPFEEATYLMDKTANYKRKFRVDDGSIEAISIVGELEHLKLIDKGA